MFKYSIFKENLSNEEEKYVSFGIKVEDTSGNIIKSISDISIDEYSVRKLCDRCNEGQLNPIHFHDVVEDFLS